MEYVTFGELISCEFIFLKLLLKRTGYQAGEQRKANKILPSEATGVRNIRAIPANSGHAFRFV